MLLGYKAQLETHVAAGRAYYSPVRKSEGVVKYFRPVEFTPSQQGGRQNAKCDSVHQWLKT